MRIIYADPGRIFNKNINDYAKIFSKVIKSKEYILGRNVELFEKKVNKYLNDKGHFISCANGTDAITLAIKALDIKPKSLIIVPSHTAPASIIGIINADCIPYYADIDENYPLISIKSIKEIISKKKIAAILAIHLYGMVADIINIKKIIKNKNIKLIEDCSQSFGSKINNKNTGTLSDAGTFSFFPTKNLSTIGDGGGVWVPNTKLKNKIKMLRQYGWSKTRIVKMRGGINSRLDEIHAAILIERLKFIEKEIKIKSNIEKIYKSKLNTNFIFFEDFNNIKKSNHLLVACVKKRNKLINHMRKKNIFLGIHYFPACHLNGKLSSYPRVKLKNTENLTKNIISLPIFIDMKKYELNFIINELNNFYEQS